MPKDTVVLGCIGNARESQEIRSSWFMDPSPDPRDNEVTAAPTYLPVTVTGLDVPREVRTAGGQLLKHVNELDLPGQRRHAAKRSRESGVGSDQAGVESNGQGDV